MDTRESYNRWAAQYDTDLNKTRDLEAKAFREILAPLSLRSCLEIGCGTGKNTVWLAEKAEAVTAVDLSEEMLAKAKEKISSKKVKFIQADITKPWPFVEPPYDLVSFSLVLEHLENLEPVFQEASNVLSPGGLLYLGELHPFKQYAGSKARFETENGIHVVNCYNHHVSDFIRAGKQSGLRMLDLREYTDGASPEEIPRILAILFTKE